MKWIASVTVFVLATVILWACSKDKFETKPLLEIKDLSSKEIHFGQTLRFRLNYFDKEGDLDEAPFTCVVRRQNIFPLGSGSPDRPDTLYSFLPKFPPKDNGEITYTLDWNYLKESTVENDTLKFLFSVKDRAGNVSDTVTTDVVVIYMQ